MINRTLAAVICSVTWLTAGNSHAATSVISSEDAVACFRAARDLRDPTSSLGICTAALNQGGSDWDTAGTYVNRGTLLMALQSYPAAQRDFEAAMRLAPSMGEAIVNLGASLIGQMKLRAGIAEITRGLPLNPSEPEKAYLNRGMAYEQLEELKPAYADYLTAAELNPTWDLPKKELTRFTVRAK